MRKSRFCGMILAVLLLLSGCTAAKAEEAPALAPVDITPVPRHTPVPLPGAALPRAHSGSAHRDDGINPRAIPRREPIRIVETYPGDAAVDRCSVQQLHRYLFQVPRIFLSDHLFLSSIPKRTPPPTRTSSLSVLGRWIHGCIRLSAPFSPWHCISREPQIRNCRQDVLEQPPRGWTDPICRQLAH